MNRQEALQKHINDMRAVEEHILDAVQGQREQDKVKNNVDVNQLAIEIERVLEGHLDALNQAAAQYGAKKSTAKDAVAKALGIAAGLYDKVRGKHPLSRNLRDNYVALSLASMGYTTLHAFALAAKEQDLAQLAQRHLKDLTPLMVEISKRLPHVVVREVAEQGDFPVDASAGEQAEQNTQEAWSTEVTQKKASV